MAKALPDAPWQTLTTNDDNTPVTLKVRVGASLPTRRRTWPKAVAITVDLPQAEVADGAFGNLDEDVQSTAEADNNGYLVFVETVPGKRTYYAYIADESHFQGKIDTLKAKHPEHPLHIEHRDDPKWWLYSHYKKQYKW